MTHAEEHPDTTKKAVKTPYQAEVYFDHQGREIRLVFSLRSGREEVYVDDALVSKKSSWGFRTTHTFQVEDVAYRLELSLRKSMKALSQGMVTVELWANDTLVDSDQVNTLRHMVGGGDASTPLGWKRILIWLAPFFALGAIAGVTLAYFGLDRFF